LGLRDCGWMMPYKDRQMRLVCNRKSTAKWYQSNKEKHCEKTTKNRANYKEQLFDILGHECIRCNHTDKRALQFDHINGGGRADQKKRGGSMLRYYAKRPLTALLTLQVLCANCNWVKRYEEKELLHNKRGQGIIPMEQTNG